MATTRSPSPIKERLDRVEREIEAIKATISDHGERLIKTETLHVSVENSISEIKVLVEKMGSRFEASLQELKDDRKWLVRLVIGAVIAALLAWIFKGGLNVPGTG